MTVAVLCPEGGLRNSAGHGGEGPGSAACGREGAAEARNSDGVYKVNADDGTQQGLGELQDILGGSSCRTRCGRAGTHAEAVSVEMEKRRGRQSTEEAEMPADRAEG